jgi:hypothetical protein
MEDTAARPVHAVIPLALLEAMRHLDAPAPEAPDEYHEELSTKRLGTSGTVAAQIERYAALARRNARLDAAEVAALLRLAGRRGDAGLVFAEAGLRAAEHATSRVPRAGRLMWRVLPGFARDRFGFRLARRAAESTLGVTLSREGSDVVAVARDLPSWSATQDGSACGLYGSAVAALLRKFTGFEGALVHADCRALGTPECRWQSAGK